VTNPKLAGTQPCSLPTLFWKTYTPEWPVSAKEGLVPCGGGRQGALSRFDPQGSDLDFLVGFLDRQPTGAYAERVLGLADALEELFGRHVDLLTEESVRNPYFRQEIEAARQLVYECADQEAAA